MLVYAEYRYHETTALTDTQMLTYHDNGRMV